MQFLRLWFLLFSSALCFTVERVDILADFDLTDIPTQWELNISKGFDINPISFGCLKDYAIKEFDFSVKRVILMNPYVAREQDLFLLPREKLVLFSWEPRPVESIFYDNVSRVYTYNDELVDGKHFFKLFYPFRKDMIANRVSFKLKKFCTMVSRHWTDDRVDFVHFFSKKQKGCFEFYGSDPGDFANHPMYRGVIPGTHSGEEKIAVLKNYRFCICFENSYHLRGYITEKIFSCFAAGCVPVYWGAPNICDYIPKNCFIDYRDFPHREALYRFMKKMPEHVYQQYIDNIQTYLMSEQSRLFSPERFEAIIQDAIMQ